MAQFPREKGQRTTYSNSADGPQRGIAATASQLTTQAIAKRNPPLVPAGKAQIPKSLVARYLSSAEMRRISVVPMFSTECGGSGGTHCTSGCFAGGPAVRLSKRR